jgi:hypothetical protein
MGGLSFDAISISPSPDGCSATARASAPQAMPANPSPRTRTPEYFNNDFRLKGMPFPIQDTIKKGRKMATRLPNISMPVWQV